MSAPVLWICGILVVGAVLVALFRVERGPSMLDRIVGLDVVIAALIGTVALWSATTGRVDLVPLLTVMAIVGFVAAVTLARFAAAEPEDEGRILSEEELQRLEARHALDDDAEEDER
ncbi:MULTISPECIES: monovalent cation/H+ antiporter complex subunit F [unclassified Pseudactinotalea]|uniref:monovalent cation/H+ antiporter complex subunit F n=1 Tax=Micrococcales TaxID=85006 RepID=UPI003C7EC8DB